MNENSLTETLTSIENKNQSLNEDNHYRPISIRLEENRELDNGYRNESNVSFSSGTSCMTILVY